MGHNGQQEEVASGRHKRRTEDHLAMGGFAILLVVGGLLMVWLLGTGPAAVALGVILIAAGLLLALYKAFELLEEWLKRGS